MIEKRIPQRSSSLEDQVVEILHERISTRVYLPESQLPSESELARELNVSRATIRGALSTLAADGVVKRRHGVGTFVSQLTRISNPLNEVIEYRELIEGHGFEFGFQQLSAVITKPSPEVSEALKLESDASVLEVNKAFTADGELLIYTLNVIPDWVYQDRLSQEELTLPGITEPLFRFLEERCGQRIVNYVATLKPQIAQSIVIDDKAPPVDPLLPVLVIVEVGYNDDEKAVLYEVEYLFGDRMTFELIRRHRYPSRY